MSCAHDQPFRDEDGLYACLQCGAKLPVVTASGTELFYSEEDVDAP